METCASIRRARPLLGTFVDIAASASVRCDLPQALDAAFDAIAQVHRLMSFHNAESDLSRVNRGASAGAVPVHPWTYQVLQTAADLNTRSGGIFDVTVAPLLQDKGLLPKNDTAGEVRVCGEAVLLEGGAVRFRTPGIQIDLGGIAKGFAVDRAVDVLKSHGVANGLVNAGGDLAAFGAEPQRVQIRNPSNPRELLYAVAIADAALASSGRGFDLLDHDKAGEAAVWDPHSRRQVRSIAGASVRAPSCTIADAMTKIVMIGGESTSSLLQEYRASALLVLDGGEVRITPDWPDGVSLAA